MISDAGLGAPGGETTLLETLLRAKDLRQACDVLLEHVVERWGVERAAVLVDEDGVFRGVVQAGRTEPVSRITCDHGEIRPVMLAAMGGSEVVWLEDPAAFPVLGFPTYFVVPLNGMEGERVGAVILDGEPGALGPDEVASRFESAGIQVARLLELERLRAQNDSAARDREFLLAMVDILPDPVVLTDRDNQILMSNRRADELLNLHPDDTGGRRRAVEVNNLFLSSHLTQSTVDGSDRPRSGELNLVDPEDGSDLFFEVFTRFGPSQEIGSSAVFITVLRDITDLKRALGELEDQIRKSHQAEQQSRRESERLQVILENVGEPILVTDQRSNIILTNREAEYLFEIPPQSLPEGPEARAIRTNDTRFTSLMSEFLLQPERRQGSTIQVKDPESADSVPVEVVSTKIFDHRGEVSAVVSVLHDLSPYIENERLAAELHALNRELEQRIEDATRELEDRNRELEEQRYHLERASRAKTDFLAGVSHELRTPINAILGYTSLLAEGIYGDLTEKQLGSLTKVKSASNQLLGLISEILDLSKIESGKVTVERERFELAELVDELLKTMEPLAREKELAVSVELEGEIDPLETDRQKLHQILLNLLSNAVKFTDEGWIAVHCTSCDGWVEVAVEDTGVGIVPEEKDAIFEEFHQSERTNRQARGGTGLGLAITRRLVGMLGGSVSVESQPGEGSVFSVRIPGILGE